jgi:hypothetical protein
VVFKLWIPQRVPNQFDTSSGDEAWFSQQPSFLGESICDHVVPHDELDDSVEKLQEIKSNHNEERV